MHLNESLPTMTATLLLADVERSTQLWESAPVAVAGALARLDDTVSRIVAAHDGVGPIGHDGRDDGADGFMAIFPCATDALSCAVDLQQAPLAPIQLRVALHTGQVQFDDLDDDTGPTLDRAARLCNLAHGGQVVLSGTTHDLVVDQLPTDIWLTDLGIHQLPELTRPERVAQVCHPDLRVEFPPLDDPKKAGPHNLPLHLTRFFGRETQIHEVCKLLTDNRLVTLAGVGGVGKTRLAARVGTEASAEFGGGTWFVDLAPVSDAAMLPLAVLRALDLPDQPGCTAVDTLVRFIADRDLLIVLDNCEHLIDACAVLTGKLLSTCPRLSVLATSRAPLGLPGELTWRVPSLSLDDEALELFVDRARLVRPGFTVTAADAATVVEICGHLDGLPLGIELAAASVRVMSLTEILGGLRHRFRLLSSAGPSVRGRTLGSSIDWSHAMLDESERVLFRRLAVFSGSFDLEAAQFVCSDSAQTSHHVVDQLAGLVDKSLVVADISAEYSRFRMLQTVRHYAMQKLQDSEESEAAAVRVRHRDHYARMATLLDIPADTCHQCCIEQVELEIDNLRAAFALCQQQGEIEAALELTSSLQPLWLTRGRIQEGLAWFEAVFSSQVTDQDADISDVVRGRALADKAVLDASRNSGDNLDQAQRALAIAREINDPALLARALTACGAISAYSVDAASPYLAEAIGIARSLNDRWRLTQILTWQAYEAFYAGDPIAAHTAAQEGLELAEAIGDKFHSRSCRWTLGLSQMMKGDVSEAISQFQIVNDDARAAHDVLFEWGSGLALANALTFQGDTGAATAAAEASLAAAADLWPYNEGFSYAVLATAAVAAGDVATAARAGEAAQQRLGEQGELAGANFNPLSEIAYAQNDLATARILSDQEVALSTGWRLARALTTRARIAIARGEFEQAEDDAHRALVCAAEHQAHLAIPDILECLARLAAEFLSHRDAARLFSAAALHRRRMGAARFKIYDTEWDQTVTKLRDTLSQNVFDEAWAEGAGLSLDAAISYVRRGRGERKRPASGWAALTPTERDVVRLVADGLANHQIAARLFISRRTVQTHLTHVYAKLGMNSRVQLAYEGAARS